MKNFQNCHQVSALVILFYANFIASSVIVDTPFGKIRGTVFTDENDSHHVVFRNIPFAKPPVGALRFAKPEPHPKLDGIFDATEQKLVMCPQPDVYLFGYNQGPEDCLVLNIYAKSVSANEKLKKVVIFIHGGGFVGGASGFYNLTSFVKAHDVIGVTINYRLGVLGFFSTGNDASPGNFGLWDQAMALQWVKDNIRAFGGDPNDVTVSGESAGGASVGYLTLSPVTKGLFTRANPQSGTATSIFGEAINFRRHALIFARHAECWDGDINDDYSYQQSKVILDCLRNVDLSAITSFNPFSLHDAMFVPMVDGEFLPKRVSVLLNDESYLESIGFYDKSYLVSIVNYEKAIMNNAYRAARSVILGNNDTTEDEKAQMIVKLDEDTKDSYLRSRLNLRSISPAVTDRVFDFYARRYVGETAMVSFVSDLSFTIPSYDFLNAATKRKNCKCWFLYFNHFPAFMKGPYRGTVHAADLLYWHDFGVEDMDNFLLAGMKGEMDDGDMQLKSLYSSVIADFVQYGNPGLSLQELVPSGWPTYEPETSFYLSLNLAPTLGTHLEKETRDLWLKKVPEWSKSEQTNVHTEL